MSISIYFKHACIHIDIWFSGLLFGVWYYKFFSLRYYKPTNKYLCRCFSFSISLLCRYINKFFSLCFSVERIWILIVSLCIFWFLSVHKRSYIKSFLMLVVGLKLYRSFRYLFGWVLVTLRYRERKKFLSLQMFICCQHKISSSVTALENTFN